jgi:hypothetical protein
VASYSPARPHRVCAGPETCAMRGAHFRRSPVRPRIELAIFLLGICLFGVGIGMVVAKASQAVPAPHPSPHVSTTTETLAPSAALELSATRPTTTTTAGNPRLLPVDLQKSRVSHSTRQGARSYRPRRPSGCPLPSKCSKSHSRKSARRARTPRVASGAQIHRVDC